VATKKDLLAQAKDAGLVPEHAEEDDFTKDALEDVLSAEPQPVANPMEAEPYTAPDGHVVLSQEDIDARLPEPK
jgi:hypothetical protein